MHPHPHPQSHRTRIDAPLRLRLAALLAGLLALCGLLSCSVGGGSDKTIATLLAAVDKMPVPPGATLVHKITSPAHGDASAYVQRQYRLTSASGASAAVRRALVGRRCRRVDLQTGRVTLLDAATFDRLVTPTEGDLSILPPGTKGGGIQVSWKADRLYLSVQGGEIQ